MMKNKIEHLHNAKIYWVYDRDLALKYDQSSEKLKSLIQTGYIDLIQFRAKGLSYKEYITWLTPFINDIDFNNTLVFANDHVEAVKELKLDGVHIGTDDMPVSQARKYLGDQPLLGATARSEERAVSSFAEGADYLGVGTVFQTTTKKGLKAKGPGFIKKVKSLVGIPVFAIGGIDSQNVSALTEVGVNSIAVASNLLKTEFPEKELLNLFKALK